MFRPRPPKGPDDEGLLWLAAQAAQSARAEFGGDLLLRVGFVRPHGGWPSGKTSPSTALARLARGSGPALSIWLLSVWLAQQGVRSGEARAIPTLHAYRRLERAGAVVPSWSMLVWGDDVPRRRSGGSAWKRNRRDAVSNAWRTLERGRLVRTEVGERQLLREDSVEGSPPRYRLPLPGAGDGNTELCTIVPAALILQGWPRTLSPTALHVLFVLLANASGGETFAPVDRGGPSHRTYHAGIDELYTLGVIRPCAPDRARFLARGRVPPTPEGRADLRSIRFEILRDELNSGPWAVAKRPARASRSS